MKALRLLQVVVKPKEIQYKFLITTLLAIAYPLFSKNEVFTKVKFLSDFFVNTCTCLESLENKINELLKTQVRW